MSTRCSSILSSALLALVLAGAGHAARITTGLDDGGSADPVTEPGAVVKSLSAGSTESTTIDFRLDLGAGEVASVFEASFDFSLGGAWSVGLDPVESSATSLVDPAKEPFGVGTWPGAFGNLGATFASVSLLSDNTGGERLVARLTVMPNGPATPGDFFEVFLAPGATAARDLDFEPFFEDVPIDTPAGTLLARVFVVPEPGSALLLGAGLVGIGAMVRGRRRDAIVQPWGPSPPFYAEHLPSRPEAGL